MIRSFGNNLAFDLYLERNTKATRQFPAELRSSAQRKLQYLNAAVHLKDLSSPPGNHLEALKGNLKGKYSIRINDRWRVVFEWDDGGAAVVQVIDYH